MVKVSRKLGNVMGAIVVAALLISVSYYELSKPPVHKSQYCQACSKSFSPDLTLTTGLSVWPKIMPII